MNKKCLVVSLACFILSGCGGSSHIRASTESLSKIKKIAVVIQNAPEFTVLYEQAKVGAAPGAFGLVGLAVASAHNKDLDNKNAALLAPHLKAFSMRQYFSNSLSSTLKSSDRFTKAQIYESEIGSEALEYDAIVTISIQNWGLRLTKEGKDMLVAFFDSEVKMVRTSDKKILLEEHQTALGQGLSPFEAYKKDSNLLLNELKEVIEGASFRMANDLIY